MKINYAHMKTTQLNYLRKLVKDGMESPLSTADLRLLLRLRVALDDYERDLRFEPDDGERRCTICGVPVSQCNC